jgi:hypothetical protein
MKLRAAILMVLTALGLVVLVAPAEPGWACSCAWSQREMDEQADLIVVGRVSEVTDADVRIAVESVAKGSVGAADTVRLRVGPHEASCGYQFRAGDRYRVNSIDGRTGLCNGIRQLPAAPPTPAVTPPASAVAQPPAVHPEPSSALSPGGGWWLGAGTLMVVAAAGLALLVRWRRRIAGL